MDSELKNEVKFIKHNLEYMRFFDNQRKFCDEISGLKYRQVFLPNGEVEKFRIVRENFILGIKRLNAYFVDNLHYIKEMSESININSKINDLENTFINDLEYQKFSKNINSLNKNQNILFNLKYMDYLLKCFKIFTEINSKLQVSIKTMIQSIYIGWKDTDGFNKNLAEYRTEITNNISDLSYTEIIDHIKKITSYYYTYSYLIAKHDRNNAEELINNLILYVSQEETIQNIINLLDGKSDVSFQIKIRNEMFNLKKAFNLIYYIVNFNLSNKRILPKINKNKLIDKTLI